MRLSSIAEMSPVSIGDGAWARAIDGEGVTLAILELDVGLEIPEHTAPYEHVGLVARGDATLFIRDETTPLRTGDAYIIPRGAPHGMHVGVQGVSLVVAYRPARLDWHDKPVFRDPPVLWKPGPWPKGPA